MRRLSVVLGVGLLVALAGAGASAAWALHLLKPVGPAMPPRVFVVEPGEGLSRISQKLEAAGLVKSALATKWLGRLRGVDARLKAGEYELSASLSSGEVLDRLASGRVKTYATSLPEGIRATEIAQRLAESGLVDPGDFIAAAEDESFARSLGIEAAGLEGYLFPETYHLARGLPARDVIRALVEQFQKVWAGLEEDALRSGMSMHEVVTLASIVEKETGVPDERPLIAAVFLNRLERGMRLETDPTVIYGIEGFDGNLRRRDLRDDGNPYNTYRIFGLPPGPIASPGEDALRAVLEPAETSYLYFVSKNDGTHHFSATYREHTNAVNRYQRRGRSR